MYSNDQINMYFVEYMLRLNFYRGFSILDAPRMKQLASDRFAAAARIMCLMGKYHMPMMALLSLVWMVYTCISDVYARCFLSDIDIYV